MLKYGVDTKDKKQRQFQIVDYEFNLQPDVRIQSKAKGSLRKEFRYNKELPGLFSDLLIKGIQKPISERVAIINDPN